MRSFITTLSSLALTISLTAFAAPFNSQGIITGSQLPPESIAMVGGGPANAPPPPGISQNAIAAFQLANFLENLESNYFQTGLKNLTQWDLSGYPSNSVETIAKVAAVSLSIRSQVHPPSKPILTVSALRPARTSPRSHHLQPPRPLQRHSPRPLRLPVPHHVSPRILRPGQHNNLRRHRRHRQPNRLHSRH